jgi:hypothetical protein
VRFSTGTDGEAIFHPALELIQADIAAVRAGTVARAVEGRLRRRNSHDVVILAPVGHNRVPLQAATPVEVSAIIITTTELLLTPEELLDRLAQLVTPPLIHKHRTCCSATIGIAGCRRILRRCRPRAPRRAR